MLKFIIIFITLTLSISTYSKDLTFKELQKAYSKSYNFETLEKYEDAILHLKPIIESYPNAYTVNYRLGWLYYLNGKFTNSLTHLKKAALVYPSSIEVINTTTLVFVARMEWDKVISNASEAITIDYYNYYANYWYSVALKVQKKYDLAIKIDRKMLTILPSSTLFLAELGENLVLSGSTTEGQQVLESVLIIEPLNSLALKYLK